MATSRKAIGIFIIAAIVVIVALTLTSGVATATKHVVNQTDPACDDDGDFYYTSIQAAVWNATDGDTIIVCPGRYNETVTVNKSNILIKAFNETKPIVSAVNNPNTHVFNITDQTNVTLAGFEIRDAHGTSKDVAGIYMNNATMCNISNNIVTNISTTGDSDAYGIWLDSSNNNTFDSSTSVANINAPKFSWFSYAYGIWLDSSNNNTFDSSTSVANISADCAYGITLNTSNSNTFSSSTSVSDINSFAIASGIWLKNSDSNRFSTSTSVVNISSDWFAYGIPLDDSESNTFSASTSVINISSDCVALGIPLKNSDNNKFTDTTIVNVTSVNDVAYSIWLDSSSSNRFTDTDIENVTSENDDAYGISLEQADDNNFTGIMIAPTITGAEFYEFWSDENCTNNVVTDMTIGNPTTISFTYGNGVWIKRVNVSERPGDPANFRNIGKYINASNLTGNSWLFVNFSYSDSDVAGMDEDTLSVWKHNGTAWNKEGWNESRILNTTNNVVGVNVTSFCILAPLGNPLTTVTIPTATGTGNVTITTSSGYFCDIPVALNASYFLGNVPDSALTFKHGFFNLSICGLNTTIPETVTINFTFPSAIPTDAEFWKYNSTNGTWYPFPFGDNDGDNVISITVTDNGPGDHNPANGTINDPNGMGWRIPVPALTPIGLIALVGLLSAIAAIAIVRKRH
jgi:hypothetical protein